MRRPGVMGYWELSRPRKGRVRTVPGDAPTALAISRKLALLSQPYHLIAIDDPVRTPQSLSFELRVAQPGANPFPNQRRLELGHRADDLEHQSTRRRGQV